MGDRAERGRRFAAMHAGPRGFVIPNPWDAGSARLLEDMGFRALATTSAGVAFSLGRADGDVTRGQVLENARSIAAAVAVPVSGDLLGGFGAAPETVAETIRLAAEAGLAGGSIEDTTGDPAAPLHDLRLAVERLHAAAEAARALPHPFVLTARSDGLFARALSFEDALERLVAYQAAAPDVLYLPGLQTPDQVRRVLAAVDRPINVLGGIGALQDAEALLDLGVARISVGSGLYAAAMGAFRRAATTLAAGRLDVRDGALPYAALQAAFARRP